MSPLFVFILALLASVALSLFAINTTPALLVWMLVIMVIPMAVFLLWGINKRPQPARFLFWLLTLATCFFVIGSIFMWTFGEDALFTVLLVLASIGIAIPAVKLCLRMKSLQDKSPQTID